MIDVLEKIRLLTEQLLTDTDMFIVQIKIKPVNNIKVYLDADDGLSISKSAAVNRKLYHMLEEEQMFPDGDFSLEVSSPGIDEPLKSMRQYKKNIGRTVLVTPVEGVDKTGILKEVTEEKIVLEVKIPKKKETATVEIPLADINKIVVQVTF
jgi:ribosome maturation factor RimP